MVVSKASGVEISGTIATVMREDGYFSSNEGAFRGRSDSRYDLVTVKLCQ